MSGHQLDPDLHAAVLLVVLTAPAQELPPELLPALLVALAAVALAAVTVTAVAGPLLRGGVDSGGRWRAGPVGDDLGGGGEAEAFAAQAVEGPEQPVWQEGEPGRSPRRPRPRAP